MINKDFTFSKIEELEGIPKGGLIFKNNSIYLDHLNLSWLSKEPLRGYGVTASLANKFKSFYGRIGDGVKMVLKKPAVLTRDEVKIFFKVSVRLSIQEAFKHPDIDLFKNLLNSVQIALVSLWRQFGRLIRPKFSALAMASRMFIRGYIKPAIRYLKDEKGWSTENKKFMLRRLKKAVILEILTEVNK
jgi:hypothetical protein